MFNDISILCQQWQYNKHLTLHKLEDYNIRLLLLMLMTFYYSYFFLIQGGLNVNLFVI
jgi:hypothetical protein